MCTHRQVVKGQWGLLIGEMKKMGPVPTQIVGGGIQKKTTREAENIGGENSA